MTHPEPDSMADLIADCADIPTSLRAVSPQLPLPRLAPAWRVDELCLAQVADIDEFV